MLSSRAGSCPDPFCTEELRSSQDGPVTVWRRADRVLWRYVLDDVVLLTEGRDTEPFVVGGGRALWEALAEETAVDPLAERLRAIPLTHELLVLLNSLADLGVIQRSTQ